MIPRYDYIVTPFYEGLHCDSLLQKLALRSSSVTQVILVLKTGMPRRNDAAGRKAKADQKLSQAAALGELVEPGVF